MGAPQEKVKQVVNTLAVQYDVFIKRLRKLLKLTIYSLLVRLVFSLTPPLMRVILHQVGEVDAQKHIKTGIEVNGRPPPERAGNCN